MWFILVLMTGSALAASPPLRDGMIEGAVVNAADRTPVPRAEVVLRAKVDGQLLPVAETTADAQGRFRFTRLPADGATVYLPGANRGGIHYPGPSVRLSPLQRRAEVTLTVHDAVTFPNPLAVRRHTITLCPEPGVLRVTESMLIDNPSAACYVGQAAGEDAEPVTLQLAIPADFAQVTFANEFFGRRFSLSGGKLVTAVPWPPGQRELTFSYVLANTSRHYVWQRPLDLPSTKVRVLIRRNQSARAAADPGKGDNPIFVDTKTGTVPTPQQEDGEIAFDSGRRTLSAGYLLSIELDHMPVTLMTYAPWAATATLVGLLLATCLPVLRRRRDGRPTLASLQDGDVGPHGPLRGGRTQGSNSRT